MEELLNEVVSQEDLEVSRIYCSLCRPKVKRCVFIFYQIKNNEFHNMHVNASFSLSHKYL